MHLEPLIELRHQLHRQAEVSGAEKQTNQCLNDFLLQTKPDLHLRNIGGYGIAVVFRGEKPGKRILFRADIDALPIREINEFSYASLHDGVSHKCGHDGHSAVLAGLALSLGKCRPMVGEVVLLFQPAEETGEGAKSVIADPLFGQLKPDLAFAWHNLPGFPLGSVVYREEVFAAASVGLSVKLEGKTAHASQPETGRSPALALAELIRAFEEINTSLKSEEIFSLITITHARLGSPAFGIAPGEAHCYLTLRSTDDTRLKSLQQSCVAMAEELAAKHGMMIAHHWHEAFPATINDGEAIQYIIKAAQNNDFPAIELPEAFRWSEDFGQFGSVSPVVLFGMGAGLECPALHNPDYDFPDSLIEKGVVMLETLCRQLCGKRPSH